MENSIYLTVFLLFSVSRGFFIPLEVVREVTLGVLRAAMDGRGAYLHTLSGIV